MHSNSVSVALLLAVVAAAVAAAQAAGSQYSEQDALLHLHYARAAFCTEGHILNWDCGPSCEAAPISRARFLGPGPEFKVQGYVAALPSTTPALARSGQNCVVAFRGSVDPRNWIADAEAWQTAWPPAPAPWCAGCTAHHGFAGAYEELREQLVNATRELGCSRLAAVGHSLGAAVATLAALEARAGLELHVEPVYLFGAPRVGNAALARAFQAAAAAQGVEPGAWRVVHYHDPVPRIAPVRLDYEHVPREVYYYKQDESAYRVCNGSGEDPQCSAARPLWQCISLDHLTYLNLTMNHRQLPEECVGGQPTSVLV